MLSCVITVATCLIVIFWYFIANLGLTLHKLFEPSLLVDFTTLVVSLLIPIAIMLLDSKASENASENQWAKKVLKKQIIHFKDILNYIILIALLIIADQLLPQLALFIMISFAIVIGLLIVLVKKYIDWINIDGLGNAKAIEEQKALLTSSKYQLSEQSFYWQLFLAYGCSSNKNSSIFNPDVFYKIWEKAAANYKDETSPEFNGFCALLADAIPKLKLNFGSSFDEGFYKHCIEKYLKGNASSKRNWSILTSTLTSYVEKEVSSKDGSFSYYRCVNTLNDLVNSNLMDNKALDYINKQFLQCLLSCKEPYNKPLEGTNFQITSNDFNRENDTYKQTISLMKQFILEIRRHEYHYSMDMAINMLFPKANGIAIGRLDYLINCAYTFMQNVNLSEESMVIDAVNIVEGAPKFGLFSACPNEEMDISGLSEEEIRSAENLSYQESIKIYASFYQRLRGRELLKDFLERLVKIMESQRFYNVLSKENNSTYLVEHSKVYVNMLQDFIPQL